MKKIKKKELKFLFLIALSLFAYLTWMTYSWPEPDLANDDFIRFHVIANSDSKEDQALKLTVRDGLLEKINGDLAVEAMARMDDISPTEAAPLNLKSSRDYILQHLNDFEREAERIIRENGCDYTVKAELGVRWIPQKTYGNITFPAGNYEALNIIIGSGKGQNWWCVLFPPLCLIDADSPASAAEVYESEEALALFGPSGMNADGIYGRAMMDEKYQELMKAAKSGKKTTLQLKFKSAELLKAAEDKWNN